MKIMKFVYAALLALCVFVICGFDSCGPTPPQTGSAAGGFPVTSSSQLVDSSGITIATSPAPGINVSGNWTSDNTGSAGPTYNFLVTTDGNGNAFVNGGRVYANWNSSVFWAPPCGAQETASAPFLNVSPYTGIGWVCITTVIVEGDNTSTHFAMPGAAPSTLTSYGNFSTTYGVPGLRVYQGGTSPALVSAVSASTTTAGSSATFPFPTRSGGAALGEGFYSLVNTNQTSTGTPGWVNSSYLAVGGSGSMSSVFGVDAGDVKVNAWWCTPGTRGERCQPGTTGSSNVTTPTPIFTQYYANQVSYKGRTLAVGSEPVAIKEYGTSTVTNPNLSYDRVTTTQPANAIVANLGSGNVSILDLVNSAVLATVTVGTQPIAVTVNSAGTMAYVANYGSGTVSEINLSTRSVSRTASVGPGLMSVAMDPSGSYVWAGGTNYLYEVSLSSFTVASTVAVSGSVTSLAASNAQNELVYTLVQNCCSASSTYAANELLLTNRTTPGTYAHTSAADFAPYTMQGSLPSAAVLPTATNVVSTRFSNGMAASSTPTGFVVYDVVSHQQIMTGTTPTPVRGIASDPAAMFAYFTLPDSNEYIAVPLESTP
jgi:YVTN family beta-propeller protein